MADRPAGRTRQADDVRQNPADSADAQSSGRGRPARQTRQATSRRRQSWSGWGEGGVAEKDGVGVFLDDVAYVFADISAFGLPFLYALLVGATDAWFPGAANEWIGLKTPALVGWLTMVVAAALIRGGWVAPLATDALGWVALTPWLVAFRLGYFNAALALATFAGRAVEVTAASFAPEAGPPAGTISAVASIGVACAVGALAAGAFPRLAESFYAVVAE